MRDPEGTGEKFNLASYMEARKLARKVALLFASHAQEGMSEEEGLQIANELLEKSGVVKKWHPTKVRFGENTVKGFREKSEPGIKLKKEDIFFIDIGPVVDGQEADFGQTFTLGQNEENSKIQRASKKIWDELALHWKQDGLTGQGLYSKAKELAAENGYELNEQMQGHRLGDFPHAVFCKGKLGDFEKTPKQNLWVLEVHLRHPTKKIGAFYEDILQ